MMDLLGVSLPIGAELIIIVIGVAYTLASVFLQRKLMNPKRMREVQGRIKLLTNEMNALVKSNATKEQIAAKQGEVMQLMSESMRSSLKPMFVVLPIFLVLYYVMLPAMPLGAAKSVQSLFFYTVFVLGLIASAAVILYDRSQAKKEQAVQQVDAAGYRTQV
jgi:uncharacterized membrane protein (DUF106 family)